MSNLTRRLHQAYQAAKQFFAPPIPLPVPYIAERQEDGMIENELPFYEAIVISEESLPKARAAFPGAVLRVHVDGGDGEEQYRLDYPVPTAG